MTELLRMGLDEEEGRVEYSVRLLSRFGIRDPYLTPDRIQSIWIEYSQHDVLFSDYTQGQIEPFLDMLFDPRAIIAEIVRVSDDLPMGLMMLNRVILRFDALGHFTWWNKNPRGKEPLFLEMMRVWMTEFELRRVSTETPGIAKGLIRMIERLGFQHEGVRREGQIHKGTWIDLEMFGILRSELDAKLQEA